MLVYTAVLIVIVVSCLIAIDQKRPWKGEVFMASLLIGSLIAMAAVVMIGTIFTYTSIEKERYTSRVISLDSSRDIYFVIDRKEPSYAFYERTNKGIKHSIIYDEEGSVTLYREPSNTKPKVITKSLVEKCISEKIISPIDLCVDDDRETTEYYIYIPKGSIRWFY